MIDHKKPLSILWLRRDLRLYDHAALHKALEQAGAVQPVFVFDQEILGRFPNPDDRRLSFIAQALAQLHAGLTARGGGLLVLDGKAREVIPRLAQALGAARVVASQDYEPATMARDEAVAKATGGTLTLVKDHLLFGPNEVVKDDGTPFKVFTPYHKACMARFTPLACAPIPIKDQGRYGDFAALRAAAEQAGLRVLDAGQGAASMLEAIGYREQALPLWPANQAPEKLKDFIKNKAAAYKNRRDFMGSEGTSRLSPYLRFGLISVRECFRLASELGSAETWLKELVWREFYAMILYHFPESAHTEWNPAYRGRLEWSGNADHIEAWKKGKTGYPVVDAAMRELLETGWMHNRARMIAASFLTKDLRIDWRVGEEHFAQYLMDYEMASNVGGWQWSASTGTDAQPWFRIFNPYLQSRKFDPDGAYIRRFVPELAGLDGEAIHEPGLLKPENYPAPIVDHYLERDRTLAMFKKASA